MTRILLQLLQHALDHIAHDWLTLPRPLLLGPEVLLPLSFLGSIGLFLLLTPLNNSGSLFALLLGLAANICHGIDLLSSFLVLLTGASVHATSFFVIGTGFAIAISSGSDIVSLALTITFVILLVIAISLPAGTSPSLISLLLHGFLVLPQSRCLVRETLLLPLPVAAQRLGLRRGCAGVDQWAGSRRSAAAWFLVGRHLLRSSLREKIVLGRFGWFGRVAWEQSSESSRVKICERDPEPTQKLTDAKNKQRNIWIVWKEHTVYCAIAAEGKVRVVFHWSQSTTVGHSFDKAELGRSVSFPFIWKQKL